MITNSKYCGNIASKTKLGIFIVAECFSVCIILALVYYQSNTQTGDDNNDSIKIDNNNDDAPVISQKLDDDFSENILLVEQRHNIKPINKEHDKEIKAIYLNNMRHRDNNAGRNTIKWDEDKKTETKQQTNGDLELFPGINDFVKITPIELKTLPFYNNMLKDKPTLGELLHFFKNAKYVDIKGDGNCLYYAFILRYYGSLRDPESDFHKKAFDYDFTEQSYEIILYELSNCELIADLVEYDSNYIKSFIKSAKDILKSKNSVMNLTNKDMVVLAICIRILLANYYVQGLSDVWSVADIDFIENDDYSMSMVSKITPWKINVNDAAIKFVYADQPEQVALSQIFKINVCTLFLAGGLYSDKYSIHFTNNDKSKFYCMLNYLESHYLCLLSDEQVTEI